MPKEKNL